MRVSIHQPQYLPWLGYFYKIQQSDVFVIFDTVQYPRSKSFANRNQIKTANGLLWLTVPVSHRGDLRPYSEIPIDNRQAWAHKHWKTIDVAYHSAPFMADYAPEFMKLFADYTWPTIADLNEACLKIFANALQLSTRIVRASRLPVTRDGLNTADYILAILKELGATDYVSGQGAGTQRHVAPDYFESQGVKVWFYEFASPVYRQLWGDYVADLSALDVLLNCGPETASLLEQGGRLTR